MNDLYYELQDAAKRMNIKVDSPTQSVRQSIAMMPEFNVKLNAIHIKVSIIRANNEQVTILAKEMQMAASTVKEREIMRKVEQLQQATTKATVEVKNAFTELDQVINKSPPEEPETRAMNDLRRAVQQEVAILLEQSQKAIYEYNTMIQQKMSRQIDILKPDLSAQDKKQIMDDPAGLQKLVMEQTLGKASLQLQYRVEDIQEKYRDIQKLEKSAQYCFQMLQEIALLVRAQGETLDTIGINIYYEEGSLNKAQNYMKRAEAHLVDEKKIHKGNRKKICCIIFLGLAIIGIFAYPIIMKIIKNQ